MTEGWCQLLDLLILAVIGGFNLPLLRRTRHIEDVLESDLSEPRRG